MCVWGGSTPVAKGAWTESVYQKFTYIAAAGGGASFNTLPNEDSGSRWIEMVISGLIIPMYLLIAWALAQAVVIRCPRLSNSFISDLFGDIRLLVLTTSPSVSTKTHRDVRSAVCVSACSRLPICVKKLMQNAGPNASKCLHSDSCSYHPLRSRFLYRSILPAAIDKLHLGTLRPVVVRFPFATGLVIRARCNRTILRRHDTKRVK